MVWAAAARNQQGFVRLETVRVETAPTVDVERASAVMLERGEAVRRRGRASGRTVGKSTVPTRFLRTPA
jgi:hypothetical protein